MKILSVNIFNTYTEILVQVENTLMRFKAESFRKCLAEAHQHYGLA